MTDPERRELEAALVAAKQEAALLRQKLDASERDHESALAVLQSQMSHQSRLHRAEIDALERSNASEVAKVKTDAATALLDETHRLHDEHARAAAAMKEEHARATAQLIERHRAAMEALREQQKQGVVIGDLARIVNQSTEHVDSLRERIESERARSLDARDAAVTLRDQNVAEREAQVFLSEKRLEEEKAKLSALLTSTDANLTAMKNEHEQERIRLARTQQHLEQLQAQLTAERKATLDALVHDRRELDNARRSLEVEKEAFAAEVTQVCGFFQKKTRQIRATSGIQFT